MEGSGTIGNDFKQEDAQHSYYMKHNDIMTMNSAEKQKT